MFGCELSFSFSLLEANVHFLSLYGPTNACLLRLSGRPFELVNSKLLLPFFGDRWVFFFYYGRFIINIYTSWHWPFRLFQVQIEAYVPLVIDSRAVFK